MSKVNTSPWNGEALYLADAENGAMLSIRKAREGDNKARVFQMNELEDMFATIAASKRAVKSDNFVLYGSKRKDNGRAQAVEPELKRPYTAKDGSEKQAWFGYTHEQIDAHVPVSFVVLTKWVPKKGGGNVPMPLFLAHELPYERQSTETSFQRVTAHKVNAPKDGLAEKPLVRTKSR